MNDSLVIRAARSEDAAAMARIHVESWRETYRGQMADAVLDDPGFIPRRERFWSAALTDQRFATHRCAVAELGGEMVGIAMAGPPQDADAAWPTHLYVLYVLRAAHGAGAGAGLLAAVTDLTETTALWVADPNPRAQAFYRKLGFVADGAVKVEDGVTESRMIRPA